MNTIEDYYAVLGEYMYAFALHCARSGITMADVVRHGLEKEPAPPAPAAVQSTSLSRAEQARLLAEKLDLFTPSKTPDEKDKLVWGTGLERAIEDDSPTIDDSVSIKKLKEIL